MSSNRLRCLSLNYMIRELYLNCQMNLILHYKNTSLINFWTASLQPDETAYHNRAKASP